MASPAREEISGSDGVFYDLPTISSNDLELFIKTEIETLESCQLGLSSANTNISNGGEISGIVPYGIAIPDSTQVSNLSAVPTSTCRLPSKENYSGPFQFDVNLIKSSSAKTKWEYSSALNKIFVIMECKIPLTFKWNKSELGLFVRALPVFLDQDSFEEPVRRCASHTSYMEKTNKDFEYVEHIIRCEDPQTSYEKNLESNRLSVLVPLQPPHSGSDGTIIVYSFMCKNSCTVGISRRSTGIIFTLERFSGEVVGRKMMNIRICSCPRRDMTKEERAKIELADRVNINPETSDVSEVPYVYKVPAVKKAVKRITKDTVKVQLNVPKSFAASLMRVWKEMASHHKDLTEEQRITFIEECNKYI